MRISDWSSDVCSSDLDDHRCDVCVIGGGYTGIATALHLAERGYKAIVLEARRIGWGASGRNGRQLSGGQRLDPEALIDLVGRERPRLLWDLGEEAKGLVKQRHRVHAIECDLQTQSGRARVCTPVTNA